MNILFASTVDCCQLRAQLNQNKIHSSINSEFTNTNRMFYGIQLKSRLKSMSFVLFESTERV